jgi:membrane-associated phospholipid phosphatase
MPLFRLAASALFACAIAVPAFAQEPIPVENGEPASAQSPAPAATPEGSQGIQLPPTSAPDLSGVTTPTETTNLFRLSGRDFKNFFRVDTVKVFSYVSLVAFATAPWDREGVNNGFNIPTTLFESGNLVGQFLFQAGAGMATYAVGKSTGNRKLALVGRDVLRAQILSQSLVQVVKVAVRRERPDGSNNMSFPSGHAASAFATAGVLHRHYGWKAGVPAYAIGSYVSLARMAWNRHHATDVVMGAGFGLASARTVTMSMAGSQFNMGVRPETGGASLNFTKIYK